MRWYMPLGLPLCLDVRGGAGRARAVRLVEKQSLHLGLRRFQILKL